MPHGHGIHRHEKRTEQEFCYLTNEIAHHQLVCSHTVVKRYRFNVHDTNQVEEYRNGRKPQKVPFGDEQMVTQSHRHSKDNSGERKFLEKLLSDGL